MPVADSSPFSTPTSSEIEKHEQGVCQQADAFFNFPLTGFSWTFVGSPVLHSFDGISRSLLVFKAEPDFRYGATSQNEACMCLPPRLPPKLANL